MLIALLRALCALVTCIEVGFMGFAFGWDALLCILGLLVFVGFLYFSETLLLICVVDSCLLFSFGLVCYL